MDILKGADHLLLEDLKAECEKFLVKQVSPENCLEMIEVGKLYRSDQLKNTSLNVALENVREVASAAETLEASFDIIHDWLSSDGLVCEREEDIFEFIVKWTGS